jgi:hypothetical protein
MLGALNDYSGRFLSLQPRDRTTLQTGSCSLGHLMFCSRVRAPAEQPEKDSVMPVSLLSLSRTLHLGRWLPLVLLWLCLAASVPQSFAEDRWEVTSMVRFLPPPPRCQRLAQAAPPRQSPEEIPPPASRPAEQNSFEPICRLTLEIRPTEGRLPEDVADSRHEKSLVWTGQPWPAYIYYSYGVPLLFPAPRPLPRLWRTAGGHASPPVTHEEPRYQIEEYLHEQASASATSKE